MGDWERVCSDLSQLYEDNARVNFNIKLTRDQVSDYLESVIACRVAYKENKLEAAIFVSKDGECGFLSISNPHFTSASYLLRELKSIIQTFPENVRSKLWCVIQNDNTRVLKYVTRLNFKLDIEKETKSYFTYKEGE